MMALFDDVSFVQAMLDFERALAFAQAENGIFEPYTAEIIGSCCDVLKFDIPNMIEQSVQHGTIVVPLVRQLTDIVAEKDKIASNWVHFGATSQDTIDTAIVMQFKKACFLKDFFTYDLGLVMIRHPSSQRRRFKEKRL